MRQICVLLVACAAVVLMIGCGFHPANVEQSTTTTSITVTAAASSARLGESAVQFSANTEYGAASGCTWAVNGTAGGSASLGTIDVAGKYTPPAVGAVTLQNPTTVSITASAKGVTSAPVTLTLLNPVPSVTAVTGTLLVGVASTIQVTGANFVPGAQVIFGGSAVAATVTSATQLTATVTAAAAGEVAVSVKNPEPGAATSSGSISLMAINPVVISGEADKGPLQGAKIEVWSVNTTTGADVALLGSSTTDDAGQFSVTLNAVPAAGTPLRVKALPPGQYVDDTDTAQTIAYGIEMDTLIDDGSQSVSGLAITPITDLINADAVAGLTAGNEQVTASARNGWSVFPNDIVTAHASAKALVKGHWGFTDDPEHTPARTDAASLYSNPDSFKVGLLSGAMLTCAYKALGKTSGVDPASFIKALGIDLGDGLFDGMYLKNGAKTQVVIPGTTVLLSASAGTTDFLQCISQYAGNANGAIAGAVSSSAALITGMTGSIGNSVFTSPATPQNPAPAITSLSPNGATAGNAAFTLTVNGSGFLGSSVVRWNGADRATTYVNSTQLTAAIGAADISAAGNASVTVFNPLPGGGTSSASAFTVTALVPTIASIAVTPNPANATVGDTVQFTATATMSDNSAQDVTATATWQSDNAAVATMDTGTPGLAHGVAAGTANISASQGGKSGAAGLTVAAPAPTLPVPFLVKDVNSRDTQQSQPRWFTTVGTQLFFQAADANGTELWKTDGTPAGTVMVKDICPGSCSSVPQYLTEMNGTLYFAAAVDGTQSELWKSDGSEAGTVMVKQIYNGWYGGLGADGAGHIVNANGTLFFVAYDNVHGNELWKSDGTEAGTILVKDIVAGGTSSDILELTAMNGKAAFLANDAGSVRQVWVSDGSDSGTVALTSSSGDKHILGVVNNVLFYGAANGVYNWDLWTYDGTGGSTTLVTTFSGEYPNIAAVINGTIVIGTSSTTFSHGAYLWTTDGTGGGTVKLKNLCDVSASCVSSGPSYLATVNNRLFFAAPANYSGTELWMTDGTANGTVLVKDIYPGQYTSTEYWSSYPMFLSNLNGSLAFLGRDSTGYAVYTSDGTANGTAAVKYVGWYDVGTPGTAVANGIMYFDAADELGNGYELWRTDGTAAGTYMLKNIYESRHSGSNILYPTDVNGTLFFTATDGIHGQELWKSDGTDAGTVLVKDTNPGSADGGIYNLINAGGSLFFTANSRLWKSDGSETGTVQLSSVSAGAPTSVNGTVYFAGNNGGGAELWKSDGTPAGTVLVQDVCTGTCSSNPASLTNVNGTLFFVASDGAHGSELWKSDGSAGGTTMVLDINPGSASSNPSGLLNVNGTLFFAANDGVHGTELWKSDGTAGGTVLVKDIWPGANSAGPGSFFNYNGTLLFAANDGTNGTELWKSDGSEAGTVMVQDINYLYLYGSSYPEPLILINGKVLLRASTSTGAYIYQSDGSDLGTTRLDFATYWDYRTLTLANGMLYFTGLPGMGANASQLWISDGSSAAVLIDGTYSGTSKLVVSGHYLFFVATETDHGSELWAIDLTK